MPEETNSLDKAENVKRAILHKEAAESKLKDGDIEGATETLKNAAKDIMAADSRELYLSLSSLFIRIAEAEIERRKKLNNIGNSNKGLYDSGEFNDRLFSLYASAAYMSKCGGDRRAIADITSTYKVCLSDYADKWDGVFTRILKDTT
jgi:hypothetical protein